MLRILVLALVLVNALLLSANLGWLGNLGLAGWPGMGHDREPERLARQVNPQAVGTTPGTPASVGESGGAAAWPAGSARAGAAAAGAATGAVAAEPGDATAPVAAPPGSSGAGAGVGVGAGAGVGAGGAGSAPAAPAPVAAPTACLQVAPLRPDETRVLLRQLVSAGLGEGSWRTEVLPAQTSFLIVMGRYGDPGLLQRKQAELRRRQVEWTVLEPSPHWPAALTPGLSLGRFVTEAAADSALARLEAQGVRTARVVELPPVAGLERLQLPALTAAQRALVLRVPTPDVGGWASCGASQTGPPPLRNARR